MLDLKCWLSFTILVFISVVASFRPMNIRPARTNPVTKSNILPRRSDPSYFPLYSQSDDALASGSASSASMGTSIRFLGRGENAIVRPGVVLVAPPDEYHHFLRQAAVFIYAMGEDDDGVYVVRGAIIDHPTPFSIHEMMPDGALDRNPGEETVEPSTPVAECLQNFVYRGGELGDSVFMLHSDATLADRADQEMIGSTGIFQGGLSYALTNNYSVDPRTAKFFFSYMEFTELELDEMMKNRLDETTQWVSVEVPPEFVLNSEWKRGEAWARLRNAIREK